MCFFRASLSTLRFVVAVSGNDGCVLLVKKSESSTELVVGNANGNGMVVRLMSVVRGRDCGDEMSIGPGLKVKVEILEGWLLTSLSA